jgi:hypothetical protein
MLLAGQSIMLYLFPFENLVTIDFRLYNPGAPGKPNRVVWPLRNYMWATAGPAFCARVEEDVPFPELRYQIVDGFCQLWRFKLENMVKSDNTVAGDQIIRYPSPAGGSRYTFSFWAIPEENYPTVLSAFFTFCRKYYDTAGYRTNMLCVGYRVLKDQQSLLSYSWNGNMITIDPVSTANPGWQQFLPVYNRFQRHGGVPLLNQTPFSRAQEKALRPLSNSAKPAGVTAPFAQRIFSRLTRLQGENSCHRPWNQRAKRHDFGSSARATAAPSRGCHRHLTPKPPSTERGKNGSPANSRKGGRSRPRAI